MGHEPSLYEGDVDVDGWVQQLQLRLDEKGYTPGAHDGWFGENTRRAVEQFQRDHSGEPHFLTVDGIVGNATWAALMDRDPEPPGYNNGPHGDTRPHAAGSEHGARVDFDGPPQLSGGTVTVSVQVTGTNDVKLTAYLESNVETVAQSEDVHVTSSGVQYIPIHLNQSGTFTLSVWATIDGGTAHAVSETVVVTV